MTNENSKEYLAIEKAAEEKSNDNNSYFTETAYMAGYVDGATSSQPKAYHQRWIPVSEALPDNNRDVLIYSDGCITKGYYYGFCWHNKEFHLENGSYLIDNNVVLWQELPPKPKPEL